VMVLFIRDEPIVRSKRPCLSRSRPSRHRSRRRR
jgi:hypothetical protein